MKACSRPRGVKRTNRIRRSRWLLCLFIADCVLLATLCMRSGQRKEDVMEASVQKPVSVQKHAIVQQKESYQHDKSVRKTETMGNGSTKTEAKKIALTFDDGPNESFTEMLLEGLKKRNVKATFFLLGKEAEKNPELVKKIYEDGHLIGNHSYSHVNLSELNDEEALGQINHTNQIIFEITGYYPEFIRPPFGRIKEGLSYEPEMIEVLWNVDARDWETDDTGYVVQKIVSDAEENGIILLHDASASSVQAAFAVIDILKERGYTFVTVDEILLD